MNLTVQTTTSTVHVRARIKRHARTHAHSVSFQDTLYLFFLATAFADTAAQIFAVCNSDKTRCFHQHYCELSLLNGVKTTWTDFQRMEGGRTFLTGVWWSQLD